MDLNALKQQKAEATKKLLTLQRSATDSNEPMTDEQITEVKSLKRSLDNFDVEIQLAEQEIDLKRSLVIDKPVDQTPAKEVGSLAAVRSLSEKGMTPELIARNSELAENVQTQGVFAKRNYSHGTNGAAISPSLVRGLNILEGRTDLYRQCGSTIYEDLKGSTQRLPFMDAFAGQLVAEKGAITRDQTAPTSVELVPERYGIQIEVTREGLATFNQVTWDGILANAAKAIDRKISAQMYAEILAGATTVTGADDLSKASFDLLESSVAVDGSYFMKRKTFYGAKSIAIDSGSGQFLAKRVAQDIGETYEGVPIFHSGLFVDATDEKYVAYGVPSNIAIGFWGNDAYELIVDPFTKAANGTLVITISRIADIKIPNVANAFVKSADLDPAESE